MILLTAGDQHRLLYFCFSTSPSLLDDHNDWIVLLESCFFGHITPEAGHLRQCSLISHRAICKIHTSLATVDLSHSAASSRDTDAAAVRDGEKIPFGSNGSFTNETMCVFWEYQPEVAPISF